MKSLETVFGTLLALTPCMQRETVTVAGNAASKARQAANEAARQAEYTARMAALMVEAKAVSAMYESRRIATFGR